MKTLIFVLVVLGIAFADDYCWKNTNTRDAGTVLTHCPPGTEKSGLVCYKPCKPGYTGVGPVCYANCAGGQKDTGAQCEKKTHNRGIGRPLHECPAGTEQNGALCYQKCKAGFTGVGHICWQNCPEGYINDGLVCRKDAHIYGKGCCCFFGKCCGNCPAGYTDDGCVCRKNAHIFTRQTYFRDNGHVMGCGANEVLHQGICYNKCPAGFTGSGPVCWENCKGDTSDIGMVCVKKSYARDAGVSMMCAPGLEQSGLLCYKEKCPADSFGVGPVCWHNCPKGWTDCGAGCGKGGAECADKILGMIVKTGTAAATVVATIVDTVAGTGGVAGKVVKVLGQVAHYATKSAVFLGNLTDYAIKIQKQREAAGKPVSLEGAMEVAQNVFAHVLSSLESKKGGEASVEDGWQEALGAIATADPTGSVAAVQAFIFPTCDKIKDKIAKEEAQVAAQIDHQE